MRGCCSCQCYITIARCKLRVRPACVLSQSPHTELCVSQPSGFCLGSSLLTGSFQYQGGPKPELALPTAAGVAVIGPRTVRQWHLLLLQPPGPACCQKVGIAASASPFCPPPSRPTSWGCRVHGIGGAPNCHRRCRLAAGPLGRHLVSASVHRFARIYLSVNAQCSTHHVNGTCEGLLS